MALNCFLVTRARRLIDLIGDSSVRTGIEGRISKYLSMCELGGFPPDELETATEAIARHQKIRVDQDTVVVRINTTLWESIDELDETHPALAGDFRLAAYLRGLGYHVRLAPQFSRPGPSLRTPFDTEQAHRIVFVDRHKFSRDGPFVHFKKTHNRRVLVDRRGYSGWSEVQTLPERHDFRSMPAGEARRYFASMRQQNFASSPRTGDEFAEYGSFGIFPMQIPGDSVIRLSRFDFFEMIEATIDFFGSRGLNTVLRRHPKCRDREVTSFLQEVCHRKGVFVSNQSSRDMILFSRAVALCNSSMGWDAILAGKPLICFGDAEYGRVAYQVFNHSDLEEAPPFEDMVNTSEREKFTFYFWSKHVVDGQAFHSRVAERVSELMGQREPAA